LVAVLLRPQARVAAISAVPCPGAHPMKVRRCVPERSLLQRLQVRAAALISPFADNSRVVTLCLIGYAILLVPILVSVKWPQDLYQDSVEAYAWGRQFLGGYGRHPPMTGWISGVWYRVFPATNWSSYLLSHVMVGISLISIYLIARRALDARRATFTIFILMLYPLFHLNSDRFGNYQVLLALLPLLVLAFLNAFEKRTAVSGVLLGLAAAAAILTHYSAALCVFAIGLAAVLHRDRRRFFTSPAPYWATAVCLLGLSPHLIWLFNWDLSSLRWVEAQTRVENPGASVRHYLYDHAVFYVMPIVGAALALWPLRWRAERKQDSRPAAFLVMVIGAVLVCTPPLLAIPLHFPLKSDWGKPLFFLAPIMALLLLPRLLITRRAVASGALIAGVWLLLMVAAAPVYPWLSFRVRPNAGSYHPYSEIAPEVTRLWRERYNSPLPLVVSRFSIAATVVFYSSDHPGMYADFNPAHNPWLDYPSELQRKGFVGVCIEGDDYCTAELDKITPDAERLVIGVSRHFGGMSGDIVKVQVCIVGPAS